MSISNIFRVDHRRCFLRWPAPYSPFELNFKFSSIGTTCTPSKYDPKWLKHDACHVWTIFHFWLWRTGLRSPARCQPRLPRFKPGRFGFFFSSTSTTTPFFSVFFAHFTPTFFTLHSLQPHIMYLLPSAASLLLLGQLTLGAPVLVPRLFPVRSVVISSMHLFLHKAPIH